MTFYIKTSNQITKNDILFKLYTYINKKEI